MKKIVPIALVALFGAMSIMPSCKKSDSSSPAQTMTATVNGASFNAGTIQAYYALGTFSVNGYSGKSVLSFDIDSFNTTTPMTYNFNNTNNAFGSYIADTSNIGNQHSLDSGSVVITSISTTKAKGTFTLYNKYDSTAVTSGSFNVTLQ